MLLGNALHIVGDAAPETINIVDNGAGHIDIRDANGHALGSANNVKSIQLDSGGGADNISYRLSAPITKTESMQFTLGGGATNALNLDLSAGIKGASLYVEVDGGAGADTIKVSLGTLSAAYARLILNGGAGNDSISVSDGSADIPRNSTLSVEINGGDGNDNLSAAMSGSIFGSLVVKMDAGAGNDSLNENVMVEEGSTGQVLAVIDGGAGHDDITLYMNDYSNDDDHVHSLLSVVYATICNPTSPVPAKQITPNVRIISK